MRKESVNRLLRHAALALLLVGTVGVIVRLDSGDTLDNVSLATSWLCLLLMATALAIGPLRARQTGSPIINWLPRRDIGIWAGLAGLTHLVAGTAQSMNEPYMDAYVYISTGSIAATTRAGLYSLSSVLGLIIGLLLLLLLGLSNNWVLGWLGAKKWKRLQRLAYTALFLTVVHGLMFQLLEFRHGLIISLLCLIGVAVAVVQLSGKHAVTRHR